MKKVNRGQQSALVPVEPAIVEIGSFLGRQTKQSYARPDSQSDRNERQGDINDKHGSNRQKRGDEQDNPDSYQAAGYTSLKESSSCGLISSPVDPAFRCVFLHGTLSPLRCVKAR